MQWKVHTNKPSGLDEMEENIIQEIRNVAPDIF